jgi:4-amino-4-deoxy-L-arabinose transferase-like glycosyltransferase
VTEAALSQPPLFTASSPHPLKFFLAALSLAAIIFAAIFPSLTLQEFSSTMESLNVATALEIRRTNNWLIPTLQGETRLAKPPLAAWLTASCISNDVMNSISSPNADIRAEGYRMLARQVRTLSLLAACAMLVVTAYIGRVLADEHTGLLTLVITGTSLLFLRFARYSATDIHLTLWVTVTNLLLLKALLERRWWLGFCGAGLSLALAMMSKGPVALLQSVIPLGIYTLIMPRGSGTRTRPVLPMLTGLFVFLVAGLLWYVLVLIKRPDAVSIWQNELSGYASAEEGGKPWYTYFCIIPYMAPWIAFFIVALVAAVARRFDDRDRIALLLLLVPLIVMSFFHDRYERYLLPMFPIAGFISARALMEHLRANKWNAVDLAINAIHWLIVISITTGFPLAAGLGITKEVRRVDDTPWLPPTLGWTVAGVSALLITIGIILQRRRPVAIVVVAAVLMLGMQHLFMMGYSNDEQGRATFRPMAELIWQTAPDAEVFNAHPRGKRPPSDLALYLDREVPWIKDPSTLTPGRVAKVLLMLQDKGNPEPTPPPGFKPLATQSRSGDRWWIFILPPQ